MSKQLIFINNKLPKESVVLDSNTTKPVKTVKQDTAAKNIRTSKANIPVVQEDAPIVKNSLNEEE